MAREVVCPHCGLRLSIDPLDEPLPSLDAARTIETIIPRNIRLAEAPSHGRPISSYSPESSGASAYAALAQELRTRDGRVASPTSNDEDVMEVAS